MKHETTINELAQYEGLFSVVDHITVPETNPDTDITEEVTLPPPSLIRRSQRRDDTIVWILTPPGIHERIFVADQAPVIVYLKDVDSGRFTGHVPQQQAPAQQTAAPATWQQQPAAYPAQQQAPTQPTVPQRPAAPWSNQQS
ncbi:hypothetical protein OG883_45770 [Streptomyces sp. NBC_01142]|uniref:hypothetical protein n=1 Tax=Streptomyces sp. NBC_01142 TaxID=2975865 RepID=UPI002253D847|nr:hypothetical protein [Streptomyces sp. NBC_01142]MCX4826949.1 hypothetical protein [Streptomyces sp. NBC_01142]